MTKKMKVAQIGKPGGDFELVEREIPEPGAGQVRVKVEACGICHSDSLVKEGLWPGLQYPRVPGHEVAGKIDAVGSGVTNWKKGQRVGVPSPLRRRHAHAPTPRTPRPRRVRVAGSGTTLNSVSKLVEEGPVR